MCAEGTHLERNEVVRLSFATRAVCTASAPVTASTTREDDQTLYLSQMERTELKNAGYDMNEIASGGYKIITTFDKGMIADAVREVGGHRGRRGEGRRDDPPEHGDDALDRADRRGDWAGSLAGCAGGENKDCGKGK